MTPFIKRFSDNFRRKFLAEQHAESEAGIIEPRAARRTAGATVAIAALAMATLAIAIAQFFIAHGQLAVMQGQLDAMRLTVRPWVGAIDYSHISALTAGKEFKVPVVLRNSGTSPALDLQGCTEIVIDEGLRNSGKEPSCGVGGSQFSLLPGGDYTFHPSLALKTVTSLFVDDIKEHRKTIVLVGIVRYRDSLGQNHRTQICAIYNPELAVFTSCSVGNDAD